MKLRFARSATKHRVSRARARFVIEHWGLWFEIPPPDGSVTSREKRLVYLGDDETGTALEVMAIEPNESELLVIHAMKIRIRYHRHYEEAKKWRL